MARTQQQVPQAPQVEASQVADLTTMLKQARGEFQAECVAKARKYRLYFATRERLKNNITSTRNLVPAGTKAEPAPQGVQAGAFRALIDELAAGEKLLREEEKRVKADAPMPAPHKVPVTSGPTSAKRYSRRQEATKKLKKLLKDIYGDKKGALRFGVYKKWAKEAGQEGSPSTMWGFLNGDNIETRREIVAARTTGAASSTTAAGATDSAAAPIDAGAAAPQGAQAGGGVAAMLWPTDRPIYMRPAVIVGGVAVVGVVGWLLLSSKPKKAASPALPPKREEKQP